jgi:hypothetical protein
MQSAGFGRRPFYRTVPFLLRISVFTFGRRGLGDLYLAQCFQKRFRAFQYDGELCPDQFVGRKEHQRPASVGRKRADLALRFRGLASAFILRATLRPILCVGKVLDCFESKPERQWHKIMQAHVIEFGGLADAAPWLARLTR